MRVGEKNRTKLGVLGLAMAAVGFALDTQAQPTAGIALVRHAPTMNGRVEGSIQQTTGENVTFNSSASLTGDLLLPGTPTVRLNGGPAYGGTLDGAGSAVPSNYAVTLNSGAVLRHVIRRTDAAVLPAVAAPPQPAGTRSVSLNNSTQSPGSFATLRNLTLNSNVGQISVPAGTYGSFIANSGGGFTLGTAGATVPANYNFQNLTLNSNSSLKVVGPVIVTVNGGFSSNNGPMGAAAHPEWLVLRVAGGGLSLNGSVVVYAKLEAPSGTVTLNGGSQFTGSVLADRLIVNGGAVLRLVALPGPNLRPTVEISAPVNGAIYPAPATFTLNVAAADQDGAVSKVEFFQNGVLLGTAWDIPYRLAVSALAPGTYEYRARATDNLGASTDSVPVRISVVPVNRPPTAAAKSVTTAQGVAVSFTLQAMDPDGDPLVFSIGAAPGHGTLSGTAPNLTYSPAPGFSGVDSFAFTVFDGHLSSAPATIGITVTRTIPPAPVIGSASSAAGQVGKSFGYQIVGTNTPVSYSATGLPTGLSLNTATGLISGTPTVAGSANVVVSATNEGGTGSSSVILTILASLPYVADFEFAEGYVVGAIDGRFGWMGVQGLTTVTAQDQAHGSQSVRLLYGSPPANIEQRFGANAGETIEYFDFFTRPVAGSAFSQGNLFVVEGAGFAFKESGPQGTLQVFDGNGAGGGAWVPTHFQIPLGADNQAQGWVQLTVRLDFARRKWDLYAGGHLVAADVSFGGSGDFLSAFRMQGAAAGVSGLDDIYAGPVNPLFADLNNNGIDDVWEGAHGLSVANDNRDLSPAGNGVTVIQSYLNGTDPNDYYNGASPSLTILGGDNQAAPAGTLNPQPFDVAVWNAAGTAPLVNAPVTFAVLSGGGKLARTYAPDQALTNSLNLVTDSNGTVQVYYLQPPDGNVRSVVVLTAGNSQVIFNSTSIAVEVVDADGNGLPDNWEIENFGHPGVDANADADRDGLTNLQEYQNGSNPNDFYNGTAPRLEVLHGGGLGPNGELAMIVRKPDGTPWPDAPAIFQITSGGRYLSAVQAGPDFVPYVQVRTDSQGLAVAYLEPLAE